MIQHDPNGAGYVGEAMVVMVQNVVVVAVPLSRQAHIFHQTARQV